MLDIVTKISAKFKQFIVFPLSGRHTERALVDALL